MMGDVWSLDIETENYSWEIGGWDNTAMFSPTVVCIYDGEKTTAYTNADVSKEECSVDELKPLTTRVLGEDLHKHYDNGGRLLGHNIVRFDLGVLRDAMDIFIINKFLDGKEERIIDTSAHILKKHGMRLPLGKAVPHTLGMHKMMSSADAPVEWRKGNYIGVVKYCASDVQLTYDLWCKGCDDGFIKGMNEHGDVIEMSVSW
jgi:DEAD/DEAH box helicase domain-containing protein